MTQWPRQLILSVFIGLFGVMINLTPWGLLLEEKFGLFWLFNMRGEISAPQDVVVVSIDQPSATHLDLPITPSSWPRRLHGELVENLTAAGARVITFDLVFDKPSDDAENDEILARAIQKSRNVVLAERLGFEETEMLMGDADETQYVISTEGPTQLLPIIVDAAKARSPFPLPKVSRVNNYWTFKPGAGDVPTMAASAKASTKPHAGCTSCCVWASTNRPAIATSIKLAMRRILRAVSGGNAPPRPDIISFAGRT